MKKLAVFLLLISFSSCKNEAEIKRGYWMYEKQVMQTSNAAGFSREPLYDLEEMSEDKSSPDVQKFSIILYNIANKGGEQLNEIIDKIENLKHKILKDNSIYVPKRKDEYDFSLSDIKHFHKNPTISLSDYQDEIQEISKLLLKWRTEWFVNSTAYYKNRDYYDSKKLPEFHEPNIKNFSNIKEISKKLDFATRDCASDDQEGFKWFYISSSGNNPFLDDEVKYILDCKQSLLETLTILSQIEYQLFFANGNMTRLIRCRISGDGYQIDKIMPLAYGKDIIQKGDSLSLDVFYAFYNSFKVPTVKITNLPENSYTIRPEDGKVILKLLPTKSMTIKGTISIANKSGVVKINEWQKEIKVVN